MFFLTSSYKEFCSVLGFLAFLITNVMRLSGSDSATCFLDSAGDFFFKYLTYKQPLSDGFHWDTKVCTGTQKYH